MVNPVEAVLDRDPRCTSTHAGWAHPKGCGGRNAPTSRSRTERHGRGGWDPGALSTCPAICTSGTVNRRGAGEGDVRGLRCVEAHGRGGRKYWMHEKMSVWWGTSAVESYRKRTVWLLYPHQTLSVPPFLSLTHRHTCTQTRKDPAHMVHFFPNFFSVNSNALPTSFLPPFLPQNPPSASLHLNPILELIWPHIRTAMRYSHELRLIMCF